MEKGVFETKISRWSMKNRNDYGRRVKWGVTFPFPSRTPFGGKITFLGLRRRDEHKTLKWGDIKIKEELDDTRYLFYNERDTKTRKDYRQQIEVEPKIFEIKDQPDRCPVNLLLRYRSTPKRPMQSSLRDSPFYLQPLQPNQMKVFGTQMRHYRCIHWKTSWKNGSNGPTFRTQNQSFW